MDRKPAAYLASVVLACSLAATSAAALAAESPHQRAHACATLEARYQQLESRMRAGYSARESERLWERRRQLQAQRRALGCQDLPGWAH
ncbi:MAG: hypothetical protein U1F06_00355 [Steroidobacteraceae bacterium]